MYDAMMWLGVFVFKKVHHDESFHILNRACNYLVVYFLYITILIIKILYFNHHYNKNL